MRRLFSTFESRLPSHGLFLLRATVATALFVRCVLTNGASVSTIAPHIIAASGGLLLLFGAWTPVAGTVVAIIELMVTFSHNGDPWTSVLLASLGISVVLLGPGAWSVDARRFGLKRIEIRRSND